MKFEKFLKGVGTHGQILERENGDKWLVCGGVAMKIPKGVDNLLGSKSDTDSEPVFSALFGADTSDDVLTLKESLLFDPEGKAGDIVRVFETELGDRVGIYNGDFGLLEKKDVLTYLEVEIPAEYKGDEIVEDEKTVKYIAVLNRALEVQGFITGTHRI